MTHAKLCLQSAIWRSFWVTFLAIIIAVSPPSITQPQAQQSDVLPKLQTFDNQSCKVESKSCCGTCNTCQTEPSCPSGSTVYDDYCLPECPSGYLRYPGSPGVCLPPCQFGCPEGFEPVPLPNCPDGYYRDLRNPEQCLPDRREQVPDNCPEGLSYSRETGKCSPDCPEGTYLGENGLCRSAYERECPDGYNRNPRTGACVPGGDWPDDYKFVCMPVCPQGLTRDIYQPTRCVPPPDSCPVGFEKFREQCVPVCEQGTQRNSYGYCQPPRCEDGSYPDFRGNCRQPECPEGYDNIRGQCYQPCDQGFTRNPNNPGQCERIPTDEPDCPEGTRLNTQTDECERVPPPPPPTVKCKQGLEYNPKTKQCEPPPRVEITCPKGFTKLKSGKCARIVEEPQGCPRNFVLNRNTGDCEPIRLNVPKACPEGTEFSRRRQRCVPVFNQQEPEFEPRDDDGEPQLRLPKIDLNNNLLNQQNQQKQCPKGMAPDKKGRCVPLQ